MSNSRRDLCKSLLGLMAISLSNGAIATPEWDATTPPRPNDTEVATKRKVNWMRNSVTTLSELRNTVFRGRPKTIQFYLPDFVAQQIEQVGSGGALAPTLSVVLDGVRVSHLDGTPIVYGVFLNLPRSAPLEAEKEPLAAHYLGTIDGSLRTYAFRVEPIIGKLRVRGAWSPDRLEASFVPMRVYEGSKSFLFVRSVRVDLTQVE